MLNFLSNKTSFDLYISNREILLNGVSESASIQIEKIVDGLKKDIRSYESIPIEIGKYRVTEKNYGTGADWSVALIDFVANSSLLKAIATTGGLITFAKHVAGTFKKLKATPDQNIFLGIQTAKLLAIHYISENTQIKNIELLNKFEIHRGDTGFVDKEFLFIFGVNKYDPTLQDKYNGDNFYNGSIYTVHLNWSGVLIKLDRY